ncbi:MAG: hypothetical protein RBT67_03100, partial [Thauera sp.]|nr:hypothetical protein [Thauera sp.]
MNPRMDRLPKGVEARLDSVYRHVTGRFCSLFESQTRNNFFGICLAQLLYEAHAEVRDDIDAIRQRLPEPGGCAMEVAPIEERLDRVQHRLLRIDEAVHLMMQERREHWGDNTRDLNQLLIEFRNAVNNLSDSLIEKDLLERQSRILQSIVLSHEKITRWKDFVREILTGFYEIFPFSLFLVASVEQKTVAV